MPTKTFADRLRSAREAAQLTLDAVGKAVGVTAQAVYRWEHGKAMPSADKLSRLARMLNVTPDYLLTGTEPVRHNTAHGRGGGRTVPVYMPTDVSSGDLSSPVGQAATHFPCSPDAFAVVIWDNANAPRYAVGDQVVIDPSVIPEPEDMVLATIAGRPVFARYIIGSTNSARHVVLRHINAAWGEHTLSEAAARDAIHGVMTEHATPRRR